MLSCVVGMVDKCKSAVVALRDQWQGHGTDQLSLLEPSPPRTLRLPGAGETELQGRALTGVTHPIGFIYYVVYFSNSP